MELYIEKSDNRYKRFKELWKEDNIFSNYKVRCKCSHTIIIPHNVDRVICTYCGYYVCRDKKLEFRNKLKELL